MKPPPSNTQKDQKRKKKTQTKEKKRTEKTIPLLDVSKHNPEESFAKKLPCDFTKMP